jgi:hypothetical protein
MLGVSSRGWHMGDFRWPFWIWHYHLVLQELTVSHEAQQKRDQIWKAQLEAWQLGLGSRKGFLGSASSNHLFCLCPLRITFYLASGFVHSTSATLDVHPRLPHSSLMATGSCLFPVLSPPVDYTSGGQEPRCTLGLTWG